MMWRWMMAAVAMVGLGVVGGLAVGQEGPATTRAAASAPATATAPTASATTKGWAVPVTGTATMFSDPSRETAGGATQATGTVDKTIAMYGTPGGGQNGPKVSFFGTGASGATRVVYIMDHSGGMLDTFDFVREELVRSTGKLIPAQKFAVVMFAESVDQVFPKEKELTGATGDSKKALAAWVKDVKVQGHNDDVVDPYVAAFKTALEMKPQVVYFLTCANFDPKLVEAVAKLNTDKKAKIYTIAFVKIDLTAEENLKKIAKENGGKYKFVGERDLGIAPK